MTDEEEEIYTSWNKDESEYKSDGESKNDNTVGKKLESTEDTCIPLSRYGRHLIKAVWYSALTNEYGKEDITEQERLRQVYNHFRGSQFYARKAPLLPHYLMVRADREELKKNWEKKMSCVSILNISTDSNIAGSQFVCKIKVERELSNGQLKKWFKLKSTLCVHCNKDKERESLGTGAAVVLEIGFRLTFLWLANWKWYSVKLIMASKYTVCWSPQKDVCENTVPL